MCKIGLLTNVVSAHQLPLARALVERLNMGEFKYIYTGDCDGVSQEVVGTESWISRADSDCQLEAIPFLLVGGVRPIDLLERRLARGKRTFYMSERWFKPVGILPGWLRLLVPSYWKMAHRFARLFNHSDYMFLPIGPWALADMRLLCRIMGVRIKESQILPWGYFVSPSDGSRRSCGINGTIKILWVGRMIGWKRVDTIIKAVRTIDKGRVTLTLVGDGVCRKELEKQAEGATNIKFHNPVSLDRVRALMREHDLYILSSNGEEGWGAALNEAMVEGMHVLGTYEAGASATLLPETHLFHSGDWRRLAALITDLPARVELPHEYTPEAMAERLLSL